MTLSTAGRVQTVLGLIPPQDLGVTDAHTHVVRDAGVLVENDPDFLLQSLEPAVAEVTAFRAAGGGALVDMMPTAAGRNAGALTAVSERTGVHLIAASGFVPWALRPDSQAWNLSEEHLADCLAAELQEGIDAGNAEREQVKRLEARAGVIKIALGTGVPSEPEMRFERAAARVHRMTGAPLSVHTERGAGALDLLARLLDLGVPPQAVLVAHVSQSGDMGLLLRIAATGAYLIMDGAGKPQYDEEQLIRQLHELADAGYVQQILLALDFSRRKYWKVHGGGPGFEYLAAGFPSRLAASGFPAAVVRTMLADNAARALSFRE